MTSWTLLLVPVTALGTLIVGVLGWLLLFHARFALYYYSRGLALPRLGVRGFLGLYAREVWSVGVVVSWYVRALFRDGLREPACTRSGRPVLCVHGYTQNGTNMWGFRQALEARGRPTRAVFLGLPFRRIETYALRLEGALRELMDRFPDEGVDVVAHSMGGVVLRHVLREHPELARVVRRVVTIGTPHCGTGGARGVPLVPEAVQLARRSPFLAALPPVAELAPHAKVTTIAAERDFVVYPASTALLDGARQVELTGVGHVGLLCAPVVIEHATAAILEPWGNTRAA